MGAKFWYSQRMLRPRNDVLEFFGNRTDQAHLFWHLCSAGGVSVVAFAPFCGRNIACISLPPKIFLRDRAQARAEHTRAQILGRE